MSFNFTGLDLMFIPIINGLVEVAKRMGVNDRFLPGVAVVFGLVFSFFLAELSWVEGLVAGLAAVGLWENVKRPLN